MSNESHKCETVISQSPTSLCSAALFPQPDDELRQSFYDNQRQLLLSVCSTLFLPVADFIHPVLSMRCCFWNQRGILSLYTTRLYCQCQQTVEDTALPRIADSEISSNDKKPCFSIKGEVAPHHTASTKRSNPFSAAVSTVLSPPSPHFDPTSQNLEQSLFLHFFGFQGV